MTTLLFFLSCFCIVACLGLLIMSPNKNIIWQRTLLGSMGGFGLAALGFSAPMLNPYPHFVFVFTTACLLGFSIYAYYVAPFTGSPDQEPQYKHSRNTGLFYMAMGLVVALVLSVIVAFTSGRENETKVQQSLASVVYALADEVGKLSENVNRLYEIVSVVQTDVETLKKNDTKAAKGDSVARKLFLSNQDKVLKEIGKKR